MVSKLTDIITDTNGIQSMEKKFVKAYKQLPILWNPDHKDYSNKQKRNIAYDLLLPILRTHVPNATRVNVRQKINILRSTYRKEFKRYAESKTITPEGEICFTHKPTTWKFDAMKFLDNLDDNEGLYTPKEEVVIQDGIEDDTLNVLDDSELEFIHEMEGENSNDNLEHPKLLTPLILNSEPAIRNSRKRSKYVNNDDSLIDRECNAIGSNVACKLQRMSPQQRYYAELLINKLLNKGLNEKLTDDTDITEVCYVVDTKSESDC